MSTPITPMADDVPATDLADIERFFSEMTPAHLACLGDVYSADAWFKDPFNEVQGLDAVCGIFQHMYDSLNQPRFIVTTRVVQGHQCFLTWDFVFGLRGQTTEITVRGGLAFVARARPRWALAHRAPPRLLGRGRRAV